VGYKKQTINPNADYRYFRDPDLCPIFISQEDITTIKNTLPELPYHKIGRYQKEYGLSLYDAEVIVENQSIALYFERAYEKHPSKTTTNWIIRDLLGYLNDSKTEVESCKMTPEKLALIAQLLDKQIINNSSAKKVFDTIIQQDGDPEELVKSLGLEQIGTSKELENAIESVIQENPSEVASYKSGKDRLLGFFVGQVMKKTGGKGNPKIIQELFIARIQKLS